jgi:glutamine synthetase
MLETYKLLTANQFEAAFCMLNACVDQCPDGSWDVPVGNYPFSLVVFHTLFFADFYLEAGEASFRKQPFHRKHATVFADYEQLQDREPESRYERTFIKMYLNHCRQKAIDVVGRETEDTLKGPSGFARRPVTRAELHVYNMRHIQHHIAQLSLRLRLDAGQDIPWVAHCWREI